MKKWKSLSWMVLLLTLVMGLAACGSNNASGNKDGGSASKGSGNYSLLTGEPAVHIIRLAVSLQTFGRMPQETNLRRRLQGLLLKTWQLCKKGKLKSLFPD